jgi:methionyl-tRNA formyltransferase
MRGAPFMEQNAKLPLRVLVIGCTPLARRTFDIVEEIAELVGVVNLDPLSGAGKSRYDSFSDFAHRRPNDLYLTKDINDDATYAWMTDRKPDIILQCGWSQIFTPRTLSIPTKYCIGVHPSPLPVGRGAAIINWAIIEGQTNWGNALILMAEKTDQGDILDFIPFTLESRDTVRTAYLKVDRTVGPMLRRTLPKIADGTIVFTPQDPSQVTRYYKRKPEDGRIDPTWTAEKCLRYVRAITDPFPGAFFETTKGRLLVWQAEEGGAHTGTPGTILAVERGRGVLLQTGEGTTIWLIRVTPAKDVECWSDEWAVEQSLHEGDVLVTV